MTGRVCKGAGCCAELVALAEDIGMLTLPGVVAQIDKQLTIQIDVDARGQNMGVYTPDQVERLIAISEAGSAEVQQLRESRDQLEARIKGALIALIGE